MRTSWTQVRIPRSLDSAGRLGLAPQLAGMVRHANIDSPIFTHSFTVSRVGDTESDDESGEDGGSKAVSTSAVTVSVRTSSPFKRLLPSCFL